MACENCKRLSEELSEANRQIWLGHRLEVRRNFSSDDDETSYLTREYTEITNSQAAGHVDSAFIDVDFDADLQLAFTAEEWDEEE